jgi:hypothetical protein
MSIYLGNQFIGNGNYLGNLNIRDSNIFMSASVNNNDPAAQAFITATGISGSNATAINQLVLDLKSNSLWNKIDAAYPLIGGTSSSTSYNLIDTTTYQITWNGTITFASTGVTGNGTNGWGNTNYRPSTELATSNMHLSQYKRTTGNNDAYDIGGTNYDDGGSGTPENMMAQFGSTFYGAFSHVVPSPFVTATETGKIGFFSTANISNSTEIYKNGTSLATGAKTFGKSTQTIGLMCLNRDTFQADFSTREYAWFSIGEGLDDTDMSNFNTVIQTYQTTLGRNV